MARLIKYVFEEAAVLDAERSIVDVDIDKIREIYGDSQDLYILGLMMQRQANYQLDRVGGPFVDCMIEAIKDYFGVGIIGMLGSGIYALIKKKAWTTIAKMILKVLVKSAAKYFTVAGIVATLVYYAGKCTLTSSVDASYDYCSSIYKNHLISIRI